MAVRTREWRSTADRFLDRYAAARRAVTRRQYREDRVVCALGTALVVVAFLACFAASCILRL